MRDTRYETGRGRPRQPKMSHDSAEYTDRVSKEPYRARSEEREDARPFFNGIQQGLSHREPISGPYTDLNEPEWVGGVRGRR